jgi:hypothetical protein
MLQIVKSQRGNSAAEIEEKAVTGAEVGIFINSE